MMQLFCDILLRVFSTKCRCLLEGTGQILNPLFASSLSVQVLSYQLQQFDQCLQVISTSIHVYKQLKNCTLHESLKTVAILVSCRVTNILNL